MRRDSRLVGVLLLTLLLLVSVTTWAATASSTFATADNPLSEGGNWVTGIGNFNELNIPIGGGVAQSSLDNGNAFWSESGGPGSVNFGDDQYSKITISDATKKSWNLTVRTGPADHTCYYLENGGADTWDLYYRDGAGTFNALTTFATQALSNGDAVELRIVGNQVSVFRESPAGSNRTQIGSTYTDNANNKLTGGQPGLGEWTTGGAQITAWEGGDAPPTGCRPGSLMLMGVGC